MVELHISYLSGKCRGTMTDSQSARTGSGSSMRRLSVPSKAARVRSTRAPARAAEEVEDQEKEVSLSSNISK